MLGETASTSGAAPVSGSVAALFRALDGVIDGLAGGADAGEIAQARQEYEQRRGRVFEDEDLWERWTQAFLEWYALERPLGAARGEQASAGPRDLAARPRTPAAHYAALVARGAAEPPPGMTAERLHAALVAWLTSHRSLFEIRALAAQRVELVDLLGGGRFSVAEKRAMMGVSVGDVAELRLIGFDDEVVFGRTFCFHPHGTRGAIAEHARRIRRSGGTRLDVVDFCASLRIRCERYRHVSPVRVYEAGTGELRRGDGEPAAGP